MEVAVAGALMARQYKISLLALIVIVLALSVTFLNAKSVKETTSVVNKINYQLNWHSCSFPLPESLRVDCATLITPAQSGAFQLPVAIIRYTGEHKRSDALLYLQGGPGAAAGINENGMVNWQYFQEYSNTKRDIILMDRRGTGGSIPSLRCAKFKRYNESILAQRSSSASEVQEGLSILKQCFSSQLDFNIQHFGTAQSAEDIRALMATLALPSWNILGVSYGSRLALEVVTGADAVQNLEVRSLVLDSVYPPEVGGAKEWPTTLSRALQRFFTACEDHSPCKRAWQEYKKSHVALSLPDFFQKTLKTLSMTPVHLTVTRLNDWPLNIAVNDHLFLSAVFSASYDRHRWLDVINAMEAVSSGKKPPLKKLVTSFVNQVLSSSVSDLVFMAVDCQDNAMGTREDYHKQVALYPYLLPYIEGLWENQICHLWEDNNAALTLESIKEKPLSIPTLVLAGAYDPITPVEWARHLGNLWPHAQVREFENTGHAVLGTNACALETLGTFLDTPSMPWLSSCE